MSVKMCKKCQSRARRAELRALVPGAKNVKTCRVCNGFGGCIVGTEFEQCPGCDGEGVTA